MLIGDSQLLPSDHWQAFQFSTRVSFLLMIPYSLAITLTNKHIR